MRLKNAATNSIWAITQKLIEVLLSFAFRTILIYTLGTVYLGLSSLFSNIFSLLSLMELGVGSSIVFLMYKPLKENKTEELKSLLKVYSSFYNILGTFIAVAGLILIPFLPILIKEYNSITINLIPIYLLTLANVVMSYFFAYRRSLLEADQKSYINSINYSIFNIIGTILRILALLLFKNYNLTLVITLVCTIISNFFIYIKTNSLYSFLRDKTCKKLSKDKKRELIKRMGASMMHQLGNIIVTSTDNIIISAFIGVSVVGIYSNYTMITNIIYSMFSLIFCSITANVGNMRLTETKEKSLEVFNKLFFLNFYLYFISCSFLIGFFSNFISLWIGQEYILNYFITFAIVISLYILGMRHSVVTFINSSGLNYNTRYKALIEGLINLVLSIILVYQLGLVGVILGTIISYLLVSVWYEPFILFKHWFKEGLEKYYVKYLLYILLTIVCMLLMGYVNSFIPCNNFFALIGLGVIEFIILNIVFFILFHNDENYKYFLNVLKNFIRKFITTFVHKRRDD